MSDMIHDFLTVFALIASSIVKKVLEDNTALLQEVSTSSFPKVGHPPVVHQATQNLAIKKHAVRHWVWKLQQSFRFLVGFQAYWSGEAGMYDIYITITPLTRLTGGPAAKLAKMKRGQTSILQTGGEDSCQNVSFWVDGSREFKGVNQWGFGHAASSQELRLL